MQAQGWHSTMQHTLIAQWHIGWLCQLVGVSRWQPNHVCSMHTLSVTQSITHSHSLPRNSPLELGSAPPVLDTSMGLLYVSTTTGDQKGTLYAVQLNGKLLVAALLQLAGRPHTVCSHCPSHVRGGPDQATGSGGSCIRAAWRCHYEFSGHRGATCDGIRWRGWPLARSQHECSTTISSVEP